jgi:hypothetical protein
MSWRRKGSWHSEEAEQWVTATLDAFGSCGMLEDGPVAPDASIPSPDADILAARLAAECAPYASLEPVAEERYRLLETCVLIRFGHLAQVRRARDITEVQAEITTRSCEVLGRAINPHLFRDCVATSIAIEDPRHIGIAWRLLGHRTPSTTEMYYNQARSVEASRRLQGYLLSLRSRIGRLNWSNFSPNDRDIGRQ